MPAQFLPESLDAVTLGGVVTGGQEMDVSFPGDMVARLRYFSRDVGIEAQIRGLVQPGLRPSGTPGHAANTVAPAGEQQRLPSGKLFQARLQVAGLQGLRKLTAPEQTIGIHGSASRKTQQLTQAGVVAQFRVGIQGQVIGRHAQASGGDLTPAMVASMGLPENTRGVLLSGILEGGPADQAGIQPGDIIQRINGKPVTNALEVMNSIAVASPGTTMDLSLLRDNQPFQAQLIVAERPRDVE